MRSMHHLAVFGIFALLFAAGCGGEGSGGGPVAPSRPPAQVAALSAVDSTAPVASVVAARVRVTAADGSPVRGAAVAFAVAAGGGSVGSASVTTDASGEAAVDWTLGRRAGENRLLATVAGLAAVPFRATGTPGPAAALAVRVQPQGARVGVPFGVQPVVEVRDAHGNPVDSGVQVAAAAADGVLAGTRTQPAAGGAATFTDLALGGAVGTHTLTFTAPGLAPASASVLVLPPPRAEADRPDDAAGAQVHVVYVVPSDGADRELDTGVGIAYSVASFQNWLRTRTGGRALRMDTYQGALDVGFFRLDRTDAEVKAMGAFVRNEIERQLARAGRITASKLYLVYYDGGSSYACGGASWPPHVAGRLAAMYLRGTPGGGPVERGCGGAPLASSPTAFPGYWEFAALHDVVHTMGIVSRQSPHHTAGYPGHVPEPADLMYSGPEGWELGASTTIDVGGDDYAGPGLPSTLPNLLDSPYLGPAAAAFGAPGPWREPFSTAPAPVRALPPHPPLVGGP